MDLRSLRTGIVAIARLSSTLEEFLNEIFRFDKETVKAILADYISSLRSDLFVLIEFPYVDKVYRDSYYSYYSTKHTKYGRDCVRLSFFEEEVTEGDFCTEPGVSKVRRSFLGYIVLRPLIPKLIGRSMLSPKAFINRDFSCCSVGTNASVLGIKLNVIGFPHSSQDSETITCAETTLWGVMEYFSHKYPEYRPILPSTIIDTLSSSSYERQKPSLGLQPSQISFALKEFGFGVRIYSSETYGAEFKRILHYYVQSGIPVISALTYDSHDGSNPPSGDKRIVIGHAVTYIGFGDIQKESVENATVSITLENGILDLNLVESADFSRDLIVIDDNFPAYQRAIFERPTQYYKTPNWSNCKISSFIVPLYHKIYLEAALAKQYVLETLQSRAFGFLSNEPVVLNFFLTSSRSYKNVMLQSNSLGILHKKLLMYTSMPKFIWVAELSTKEMYLNKKGMGFILVDATATNQNLEDLIVFIAYPSATYAYQGKEFKKIISDLEPFNSFQGNLQPF